MSCGLSQSLGQARQSKLTFRSRTGSLVGAGIHGIRHRLKLGRCGYPSLTGQSLAPLITLLGVALHRQIMRYC